MIVLDTNVVSEAMADNAHPVVTAWLNAQALETLYLTTTSLAELLLGIDLLPRGKRKRNLSATLDVLLKPLFGPRILPFDSRAAVAYASLVSRAQAKGMVISVADGQIAAVAEVHGYSVATRDTKPFRAAGSAVINPWDAKP